MGFAAHRQRGAALLVALLTVGLVTTLAATAYWRQWQAWAIERTERERAQFLAIPLFAAAVDGKVSLETYRAFLTQAYHHVSQTVPLLMAVGARLPERLEWLRGAVAEYIR